jgi:hypothetical protein
MHFCMQPKPVELTRAWVRALSAVGWHSEQYPGQGWPHFSNIYYGASISRPLEDRMKNYIGWLAAHDEAALD